MPMHNEERKYRKLERKYRRESAREKRVRLLRKYLPAALLILAAAAIGIFLILREKPKTYPPDNNSFSICVLDVGQGDAILLRSQGHAALIDTGDYDQGRKIVRILKELGIQNLDCIINSHPHADHIGGIQEILREIRTGQVIIPEIPDALIPDTPSFLHALETAKKQNVPVRTAITHQIIPFGEGEIELLGTDNSAREDLNNCSLTCIVRCGAFSFLSAGDLETEGEQAMLDAGLIPPVTFLKVSHHGSSSSTGEAFLAAAKPQAAVISVGAGNDYGHPAQTVLRRLNEAACPVYRTDLDGSILIVTDGKTFRVQTHFQP